MMILADTSVWIDHLRQSDPRLAGELEAGNVAMHPFILGELACGNLRFRSRLVQLLRELPNVPVATNDEVLHFIEERRLMGRGLGLIDVHLLASVMLAEGTTFWTRDRRLADVAGELEGERPS
jgi:predicted nucleic acid-binding protein